MRKTEQSAGAPAAENTGRSHVRRRGRAGARKSGYVTIVVDRDLVDESAGYGPVAQAVVSDVLLERDVRLDSKRRATLTGAEFDHYHMIIQSDGTIVLEPRVLARPAHVPPRVLGMIDGSVGNLRNGVAGGAVDFSEFKDLLDEDDE